MIEVKKDAESQLETTETLARFKNLTFRSPRKNGISKVEVEVEVPVERVNNKPIEIDLDEEEKKYMQVADYAEEIFDYFEHLEEIMRVPDDFILSKQITWKQRAKIVDSLVEFSHRHKFAIDVIFRCVQLLDAYLQVLFNLSFFLLVCFVYVIYLRFYMYLR